MKGIELFELLGGLDPELVDGAETRPWVRRALLRTLTVTAAAACLVAAVLVLFPPLRVPGPGAAGGAVGSGDVSPGDGDPGSAAENGCGQWIDGVVAEAGETLVVVPDGDGSLRYVLTMTDRSPVEDNMPKDLREGDLVRVMCGGDIVWEDGATALVPTVFGIYRRYLPFEDLAAEDLESVTVLGPGGQAELSAEETARAVELLRGVVTVGEGVDGWQEFGWETRDLTLRFTDGTVREIGLTDGSIIIDGLCWSTGAGGKDQRLLDLEAIVTDALQNK